MKAIVLKSDPAKDDAEWRFTVPARALAPPPNVRVPYIKAIQFTAKAITLQFERMPMNRVLNADDSSLFILASFATLRFPDAHLGDTADYIFRSMSKATANSCFMRAARSDEELDRRIYAMGDFGRIMNLAKRRVAFNLFGAKRIGLLFSGAEIDWQLDPRYVLDIRDIKSGDELFSDGCGLISRKFLVQLSKAKRIIFRGSRYRGYKGVLMLHPQLDKDGQTHVHFRDSMKKFTATSDNTFSVVGFSQPYAFGRLNNEIVTLLWSLGVSREKLIAKQEAYFEWIRKASEDYPLAERVLLDGIDDDDVAKSIRKAQLSEVSNFRKNDKNRVRMMIQKSRLLYGVCDPFQVLKEGQVHIRITTSRKGPSTPLNCSVLVVRNPCLHPGDCLKLRAVECSQLSHLVDCIVFASVARPGHHAAPSMSSGGDLDVSELAIGDKFFVCWDPDLVPAKVAEPYDYPPNKEQTKREVSRLDLAKHFAAYNGISHPSSVGLAKVASLHNKWVRASAKGAMSPECQELNALHSQSVDGARVKIPDRLLTPPEPDGPFVIEVLANAAAEFAVGFSESESSRTLLSTVDEADARNIITGLLKSKQNAVSEYELFNMVLRHSRKHSIDVYAYLSYLDMGALSASEKYAIMASLNPGPGRTRDTEAWMFNSLFRSDILTPRDLYQRNLSQTFSIQRFYSSRASGMTTFFKYLRMATQDFTRKLLLLKTDDRFAIGVFMRGEIAWDEDPEVNENVVVCSFLPHGTSNMSTYRPCNPGGDTFIFMTKPPAASGTEVAVSIALQKISAPVQRQLGRLNRAPVVDIEIHVVSNRDRVAHQLFDLCVPTEEHLKRFEREKTTYERNTLERMNWGGHPPWLRSFFQPGLSSNDVKDLLPERSPTDIDLVMKTAISYHTEEALFFTFNSVIARKPIQEDFALYWLDQCPPLAFSLLKAYPSLEASQEIHEDLTGLAIPILRCMVRSANELRIAVLVGLEKLALTIARISLADYLDLLMLAALSIRAPQLLQEVLLVLHDSRPSEHFALSHAHRHGLAVSFDRAEEAADECPCDEEGKPKRQRAPPTVVKLTATETFNHVKAAMRIDDRSSGAASHPDRGWVSPPIVDGIAIQSLKGELKIEVQQPLPPEATRMSWKMYNAGSIATAKAMIDALLRLATDGAESCLFHGHITGADVGGDETAPQAAFAGTPIEGLNRSQSDAVHASDAPLSLIWGPPGTGKTTVVIRILEKLLQNANNEAKILMTASTHNGKSVDNVLERFVVLNKKAHLLTEDQILRVATDQSKVNKSLQHYTIDARVGGDLNENNKLAKQALARVKSAVIIFTTCAGAGLGILRKVDFEIALIDEASQITEPCALIPLVKGVKRAVLVGDHVQLRPTVRHMAKALEYDPIMHTFNNLPRSKVQYRFPTELASFPSAEFYEGKLRSAITNSQEVLGRLEGSSFPWPRRNGYIFPTVFIQCSTEEDLGGASKANTGQVEITKHVISLLTSCSTGSEEDNNRLQALKITALSPYSKQVKTLQHSLPSAVDAFTIDSYQGRESDIIIFSSVRCNVEADIGFVDDARRLNVMWTRARLGLIIVGDRRTMSSNPMWKRAIDACMEVEVKIEQAAG
ncbi:RdRP-domain-containing protein [Pleurotus eryngii]|uniref:RdRP-domain-containing protein n=1 Tax=Pleurotus eryngii TaxID=5323 RepID=A0A9P5ZTL6_PLEER|nr:RdRP-domain-containing protein [Pleurotus eryngii]